MRASNTCHSPLHEHITASPPLRVRGPPLIIKVSLLLFVVAATRKTGKDGVVLEETKQADRTTGQATHRISRGIHDKGHSLTRKLSKDGNIDTMQTLQNLEEDELAGFEQAWNGSVQRHLPKWNEEFNSLEKAGLGLPLATRFESAGRSENNSGTRTHASGGGSKKVITIKIE